MQRSTDKTNVQTSKLIAALDALVLNDRDVVGKKVESVNDDSESEVEIVAFGPVPIKPKGPPVKDARKPRINSTHPFFSKSSGSKRKKKPIMERTNVPKSGNSAAPPVSKSKSGVIAVDTLYSYKDFVPKPTVVYTRHEEEANELIMTLKQGPVGFDMEWRVIVTSQGSDIKYQAHRAAVVQIADSSGLILVIQVHAMSRFPKKLLELIENPDVSKLGVNIIGDGRKLWDDYGILARNLFELGPLVHLADPVGAEILASWRTKSKYVIALAKLVEYYFKKTLSKEKTIRMGNWEAELNQLQVDYAANDAHCALKIYDRLLELAEQNGIDLDENLIQQRCISSVSYPKTLTKSSSCSDIPVRDSTSKSGPVQRHKTMPNIPAKPTKRPQHLKAYQYWYERGMSMEKMRIELSLKPRGYGGSTVRSSTVDEEYEEDYDKHDIALKPTTVISYVVGALQADPRLPFEMEKLRQLVQMDGSSWERHRDLILQWWNDGRG